MQGLSGGSPGSVKRIGDLLVEAGFVNPADLERALALGKKNFQALGKVLITMKLATDQDINDALAVQKTCKHEGLPGNLAVRALMLKKTDNLTVPEALERLGWTSEGYRSYDEPADIMEAKAALQAVAEGARNSNSYIEAGIKIADAYLAHNLSGRAEVILDECMSECDRLLQEDLKAGILRRMAKVALAQKRYQDARQYLESTREQLINCGRRHTEDFAIFLIEFAEFYESRRKQHDAESCYLEAASIFARIKIDDPRSLQAIRRASAAGQQITRMPDQILIGDLLTGAGMATEVQVTQALNHAKTNCVPLGRALVALNVVQEAHLQLILQVQLLIRNGEISRALGKLIVQFGKYNSDLDKILKIFEFRPKSRDYLAAELMKASEEMVNLERTLGTDHPKVAIAFGRVAHLYFQRQQWYEAEQLYQRGFQILERAQTGSPGQAADFLDSFAELRTAQHDLDDAVRLRKLSTQLRAKNDGPYSISVAESMSRLAAAFCAKGDHPSSRNCLEKSLLIREKNYGPINPELVSALELLADCISHEDEWEKARAVFTRAHEICKNNLPEQDERTKRIVEKLINVCKTTGDFDQIEQLESSVERLGRMV